MRYSFIIPVYNRPDEIDELLASLVQQTYQMSFEVVVVEDGSTVRCEEVLEKYKEQLQLSYYYKPNSGPGNSRNYGMQRAQGDYFIILDSDCILPPHYLNEVDNALQHHSVACFGGPDAALDSFSDVQKAINFTMTSVLTTGGIRGASEKLGRFQPRSFNMGLSREAFEASGGFQRLHPGEDPDLAIRLWLLGYETALFPKAYVYHKRRIDWPKFYTQVHKFGKARPILNQRYPGYAKWTYWFPSLFIIGFVFALALLAFGNPYLLLTYLTYYFILLVSALLQTKNSKVALYSVVASAIQFYGYGTGFLKASWKLFILRKPAEEALPEMFFKS